eukprot:m.16703 g.16703  ORF g.16703 m.16703 type:complete len:932 (-) comp5770_c0_seq1:1110-3905(-)
MGRLLHNKMARGSKKTSAAEHTVAIVLLLSIIGGGVYKRFKTTIDSNLYEWVFASQHPDIEYAVNCGGGKLVLDNGVIYSSDPGDVSQKGNADTLKVSVKGVPTSSELPVYQSEIWSENDITYAVPAPSDGKYTLALKFSENVNAFKKGDRVFGIQLNNEHDLNKEVDIYKLAGGYGKAHDELHEFEIKGGNVVVDGKSSKLGKTLDVTLKKGRKENPKINGIVIVRGTIKDTKGLFKSKKLKKVSSKYFGYLMFPMDLASSILFVVALLHSLKSGKPLVFMACLVAIVAVELISERVLGSRCDRDSVYMASFCTSVSVILYSTSLLYASCVSGSSFAGKSFVAPFMTALLFMTVMASYEIDAPAMKWTRGPDSNGFINTKSNFSGYLGIMNLEDKGIKALPLVDSIMKEKYIGIPTISFARTLSIGFGMGTSMFLTGGRSIIALLLFLPLSAMWLAPVVVGFTQGIKLDILVCSLVGVTVLPLIISSAMGSKNSDQQQSKDDTKNTSEKKKGKKQKVKTSPDQETTKVESGDELKENPKDLLLFLVPLLSVMFFASLPYREPGKMKSRVVFISAVFNFISLFLHGWGCGLLKGNAINQRSSDAIDVIVKSARRLVATSESSPAAFVGLAIMLMAAIHAALRVLDKMLGDKIFESQLGLALLAAYGLGFLHAYLFGQDYFAQKISVLCFLASILFIWHDKHLNFNNLEKLQIFLLAGIYNYRFYWKLHSKNKIIDCDVRYNDIKDSYGALLYSFSIEAVEMVCFNLPIWLALLHGRDLKIDDFELTGQWLSAVALGSILLLYVIDEQGFDEIRKALNGNKQSVHTLYKFARYPAGILAGVFWVSFSMVVFRLYESVEDSALLNTYATVSLCIAMSMSLFTQICFDEKLLDVAAEKNANYRARLQSTPPFFSAFVLVPAGVALVAVLYNNQI